MQQSATHITIPHYFSDPIFVWLDEVRPEPLDWLWPDRIPLGVLTFILGDPGLGKSFLTLYMAAQVSTGGPWPQEYLAPAFLPSNASIGGSRGPTHAPKGAVCILNAEDSLEHVICPRLRTLGADLHRISTIQAVRVNDGPPILSHRHFNIARDVSALKKVLSYDSDTKLIIIDPLSAYLDGIDSQRNANVRAVLLPLVELARQYNVTIVAVTHLNKNTSARAIYRGMGSLAFLAAARSAWLVSTDPDDPLARRRLLTPLKHNILADPTALAFQITDGRLIFEPHPLNITADQALRHNFASPQTARAVEWLKQLLPPGKSLPSAEVLRLANDSGIKEDTLRKAKKQLNVISFQSQTADTHTWFWRID